MPPKEKHVEPQEPVVAPNPVVQPGRYKLMAFYLVYGKYLLFQVGNPRNVVAVDPADVEFTAGEQELSANVLSKDTSKPVFVPDSVANNLDAVRTFVLPN